MKKKTAVLLCGLLTLSLLCTACQSNPETADMQETSADESAGENADDRDTAASTEDIPYEGVDIDAMLEDAVKIHLSDKEITINGSAITNKMEDAVYAANDIVFYLEGQDFTYGEGTAADEHSQEEADAHTVVHITKPGTYALSGSIGAGQVAIDLGEDAKKDPEAVVNLILNDVDITCSVAPGVIFYNVYECGSDDTETASETVDTSTAGANVFIADGTTNQVNASHVARIYESYTLSDDGTEVVDSKKLHKYDGAFYSRCTMNLYGGLENTGILNIIADNEGLDSELHLTINGGNINIISGNDGINTNEDEISVTTINHGTLNILVNGSTGEGDGIDSNGWLIINGGTVTAQACSTSGDAGIDSDMGIHINGGTVLATGNMLDRLEDGGQNYAVFTFREPQTSGGTYTLKNADNELVYEFAPENDFTYFVVSGANLTEGDYTFWNGDIQLSGAAGTNGMMGGGMPMPGNGEMPEGMELPEGGQMPEDMELPEGRQMPKDMERPEGGQMPEDMEFPEGGQMPEGMERPEGGQIATEEMSTTFTITTGGNMFTVTVASAE